MKNLIKKASEFASEILEEHSIPVFITSDMFSRMIQGQTAKIEGEGIYDLEILFKDNLIIVKGFAKKFLLKIPFIIELTPCKAEQRVIAFEISSMSPIGTDWIKKRIFNKPPFAKYENELLQINLNGFEKVKSIPVGKIQSFKIVEDKMWIKIGL